MTHFLLIQLPIAQINFGNRSGNIPLGAACLKQVVSDLKEVRVSLFPEASATYLGDAAILDGIARMAPDIVGFSVFGWNLERSLYMAHWIKTHIGAKILMGGPEITPDNSLISVPAVDFRVFGEGEQVFRDLARGALALESGSASQSAEHIFQTAPSPYIQGLIDPLVSDMVLVETQRGCPYRCGFCYYNKSRNRVVTSPPRRVLETIQWAIAAGVKEVFLLDPSLNARPGLRDLLDGIARINADGRIRLLSEIRAEPIDLSLAEALARAGFTGFEIGLQTTNPSALACMNRHTDIGRFLTGVRHLQAAGIRPCVDLMIGLPGDDLNGFKNTVNFVIREGIHESVQVFFLSVLPGTQFRSQHRKLGLVYQPRPPYTILSTPTFRPEDMREAFHYAEDALDISLHPNPDLDLSYRVGGHAPQAFVVDLPRKTWPEPLVCKIILRDSFSMQDLSRVSRLMTHPYQVMVMADAAHPSRISIVLSTLTAENPHTPLEIVWFSPQAIPDVPSAESAMKLARPLYLDQDLPALGSRSVLHTLVTPNRKRIFGGIMKRQVCWWRADHLPDAAELVDFLSLDGLLIDNHLPDPAIHRWQDDLIPRADDLPYISFADLCCQKRWVAALSSETQWPDLWRSIRPAA